MSRPWISLSCSRHTPYSISHTFTQLEEQLVPTAWHSREQSTCPVQDSAACSCSYSCSKGGSPGIFSWMLALHPRGWEKDLQPWSRPRYLSARRHPKALFEVLSSLNCPGGCSHITMQYAVCPVAHQLAHFPSCRSFPNIPVTQCPRSFCAGGKNYNHRTGLLYVSLGSQSPEDDLIAWENVLSNLLELVISSSVICLYFWLERLKILIYQWHL